MVELMVKKIGAGRPGYQEPMDRVWKVPLGYSCDTWAGSNKLTCMVVKEPH